MKHYTHHSNSRFIEVDIISGFCRNFHCQPRPHARVPTILSLKTLGFKRSTSFFTSHVKIAVFLKEMCVSNYVFLDVFYVFAKTIISKKVQPNDPLSRRNLNCSETFLNCFGRFANVKA